MAEDIQVPEDETPVVSPDEGIAELKRKLAESEQKAAQLELDRKLERDRADEAARQVVSAQTEAQDANLTMVSGAISAMKAEQARLKAEYRAALANADHDVAADMQEAMSLAAARLVQLETGEKELKERPKPRAQLDPVEALATQLTPKSAAWVRDHPEYARNPRLYGKMLAAHNLVTADDVPPDSADYFNRIEQVLGIRQERIAAAEPDQEPEPPSQTRRSAPPAAPVNRDTNGTRTRLARLTADQVEMANMMGLTAEEYAKNLEALRKEGRIH